MKKYNYIIVSLLACLLTTSCNDYFDQVPDDRLSLKEIFTTRDGALRYLSNVYTFLPDEFNQRQVHETSLYRTPWQKPQGILRFAAGEREKLWPHADGEFVDAHVAQLRCKKVAELVDENDESEEQYADNGEQDALHHRAHLALSPQRSST